MNWTFTVLIAQEGMRFAPINQQLDNKGIPSVNSLVQRQFDTTVNAKFLPFGKDRL